MIHQANEQHLEEIRNFLKEDKKHGEINCLCKYNRIKRYYSNETYCGNRERHDYQL